MLTKQQKTKQIEEAKKMLEESETLLFADFSGIPVAMISELKRELKEINTVYKVFRKRLFSIAMKELGYEYDLMRFPSQAGTMCIKGDLSSAAGTMYAFSKEAAKKKKEFNILGGYDLTNKTAITGEEFLAIAKLPSREILLGQLVGVISGPLRAFMNIVDQMSEKPMTADMSKG